MKYNDNLIEYLCDKLLVTKKEFTKEELNSVDELVIDFMTMNIILQRLWILMFYLIFIILSL